MIRTKTVTSNRDQLPLELAIIEPASEPVGIVQILHGMAEHKERYYDFMQYLAYQGFIYAIHDHRGHGASVKDPSHLGYLYIEDSSVIVDDAFQITAYLKDKYGPLEISLFSHSMGTLVARNYLKKYDDQIDRVVMCGPPTENKLVDFALILAKIMKPFYGQYKPNRLLNKMALGPYNRGFKEENSWICSDPKVVAAYNADPLCGFTFTTNGFINLFKLQKSAYDHQGWKSQNSSLPILLIAGEEDPVIQSKQKFTALEQFLEGMGYDNVTSRLYEGKRHELLNEIGREEIYKDVLKFLTSNENKASPELIR